MFHQNPRHTGYSLSPIPERNQTFWDFNTTNRVKSSPAIVDDKVILSSVDGRVFALNRLNGTLIWSSSLDYDAPYGPSPAVYGQKVFITDDQNTYAMNLATGSIIWKTSTGDSSDFCSPNVCYERVFVCSLSGILALDPNTGGILWQYSVRMYSSVAVADGLVFASSFAVWNESSSRVLALNAFDGTPVWSCDFYSMTGSYLGSPCVADGLVFLPIMDVGDYNGRIYALSEATGNLVWQSIQMGPLFSTPSVAYGKVFIGSYDKTVYAFDETTGVKVWNFTTGDRIEGSGPAIANHMIFIGSDDGYLYALKEGNGQISWKFKTENSIYSTPAVADGIVHVGSLDGKIYAIGSSVLVPNIRVVRVLLSSTNVFPSTSPMVFINVTVENTFGTAQSTNVTVYANNVTVIRTWITIQPAQNESCTLMWNTLGYTGDYTIEAYAEPVIGETNISDNRLVGGILRVMGRGYFIIVAGNRRDNELLSAINYGCNQVYRILRNVGFSSDSIYYLNQPECGYQDLDGDGENDIDAWASTTNLRWAIETWAKGCVGPTQPLFLYLFDHGGSDVFCIDDPDLLYSNQLAAWLDYVGNFTGAPICVIYAACHSGSFIDELSRTGRVIVTSSQANEYSKTGPNGLWEAFSIPFWNQIRSGHSIGVSFDYAYSSVAPRWFWQYWWPWSWLWPPQTPLLDDNGDMVGHGGPLPNAGDGYVANNFKIGACEWAYPWISQGMPRMCFGWPPPPTVTLWTQVENRTRLSNVTAWMLPPDWTPSNSTETLTDLDLEYFEMGDMNEDGNWTVDIPMINFTNHASGPANFTFFVTAQEENGDQATPVLLTIQFTETGEPMNDTVPPIVNTERPLEDSVVFGTIRLNGTVLDDTCLDRVEVYTDDTLYETITLAPSSNSFYELNLDTTLLENGNQTIIVRAFDAAGNSANRTLSLVVINALHDVAPTDFVSSETTVYRGTNLQMNITVANHGSYLENSNLTILVNSTSISFHQVVLPTGNFTTLILNWNTTDMAYGNYTIEACLAPVDGEWNIDDNVLYRQIGITMLGDINSDFTVDIYDAILLAGHFNQTPANPLWNANVDLNGDNIVDIYDAIILANHFNQHYP
jgi:outer membrane protein assembly factor BamB